MNTEQNIDPQEFLKTLWKDIWDINIAMLVTHNRQGELRSRPMITQAIEEPNILWFADRVESPQNSEILGNSRVNLTYTNQQQGIYISVTGRAQLVTEQQELDNIITCTDNKWIPDRSKDPHLVALRIAVIAAEYWCTEKGLVSSLTDYFSAVTSDKNQIPARPEHEKIQLEASPSS